MSSFTGPLTITQLEADWRQFRTEHVIVYEVGDLGSGRVIEVPAPFFTDGASVPRWLWSFLPTWGSYSRAAVVHDYLLFLLKDGRPHAEGQTRRQCDGVFWEAIGVCPTSFGVRCLLYFGVSLRTAWLRLCGGCSYPL